MYLLFNPIIGATMTQEMIDWERECGLFPSWLIEENKSKCIVADKDGKVVMKSMMEVDSKMKALNFDRGSMAKYVADTVLGEVDKQVSRERSQKRKREGDNRKKRIMKIQKKLTAGKLVLEGGSYHLDETVLQHVERRRKQQEEEAYFRRQRDHLEYMKWCHNADRIMEKYGGIDVSKWKKKDDIITYLKPLKQSGDKAMPTSRKGVEQRFREWRGRQRRNLDYDDAVKEKFALWLSEQEDKDKEDDE